MDKALLLGNGINRLSQGKSWESLLHDISKSLHVRLSNGSKSFPMLFEELCMKCFANKSATEDELISKVIKIAESVQGNSFHGLFSSQYKFIMTTNYDYLIETSLGYNSSKLPRRIHYETKYNLFRCYALSGTKLWHIHGETNLPNSICLGYERYGGTIQHLRSFLEKGIKWKNREKIIAIDERIMEENIIVESWADLFFVTDIDIVGLGLTFDEIDLWWLLDYRARRQIDTRLPFRNRIRYFCPNDNLDKEIGRAHV